jgi:hypothetical protein
MGIGIPDIRVFFYQTFHPSVGIFWLSPVLLMALVGWFFMSRQAEYRAELLFSLVTIICYILFFSGYYAWWGGYTFAPRHIMPILPLFAIPMAFVPEKFSPLMLLTSLISIFQNLIMAASGFDGLPDYYETMLKGRLIIENKGMLVYEICLRNLLNDHLMNNRGLQLFRLHGPASLLPLFILELGLFIPLIIWKSSVNKSGKTS